MNSVEELVSYGIGKETASMMIECYQKRIGTENGDYKIIDISYNPHTKSRIIKLKCVACGDTIQREMINGRNKWNELIKTCYKCRKERRNAELKKSRKIKKDLLESEIGKQHGDYIASEIIDQNPIKIRMTCMECGTFKDVSYSMLHAEKWKDQKCHKHFPNIKYDNTYIGKRFGFLTVIGINKPGTVRRFMCRCDCGNIKNVRPIELVTGKTKSCGCYHDELIRTHGGSNDRLYHVWQNMKRRCNYPNCREYRNYGGRGIRVCNEWEDYSTFKSWAYKHGYDEDALLGECTIDRIDVNGNYEPDNCRWITIAEQQKNKRPPSEWKKRENKKNKKKTALILYNGNLIPKSDLCKSHGISVESFNYRYYKKMMPIQEALELPKMTSGRPRK
jgi:hypothetical protein|nr:MAG TPA: hypothetical protein [Caudoviricetes sp.]